MKKDDQSKSKKCICGQVHVGEILNCLYKSSLEKKQPIFKTTLKP